MLLIDGAAISLREEFVYFRTLSGKTAATLKYIF